MQYTKTMTGAQWLSESDYMDYKRWVVATTQDASTPFHMDGHGSVVIALGGSKGWCVADNGHQLPGSTTPGRMDTMYGLDGWNSLSSCTANRDCEMVILKAGDAL